MKRSAPLVVDSGHIVQLAPVLLRRAQAAAFAGCSVGYLDAERAEDVKRLRRGEPIKGPAWVTVPHGLAYRLADLQGWIDRVAVPLGVVESKRRTPSTEMPQ